MTAAVSVSGLNSLFPFQIATNFNFEIVDVGPSLVKICPSIAVGKQLLDCIRVIRPPMKLELGAMRRRVRSIVLLESIAEKVSLRGQFAIDDTHGTILFAIAPRVLELQDIETLGLSTHDFAPSDPVLDFLLVLQTKETILKDALTLTDNLKERQHSLEQARQELVIEVEERARAEEALKVANEDLCLRLETILEQQKLIARMSVPVIHVWDGVVALPVVGMLDEERVRRLSESMLDTASRTDIRIIIVDLTGIEIVRDDAARHLADVAQAARLLGRRCLFSGVSAVLARALIDAGLDLSNLTFLPNVRSAISRAITSKQPGKRRTSRVV
jgi:anti-anti-sigma regulatory factor